jgi:hypothetical protein
MNGADYMIGGIGPLDQLQVVQSSTDGPTMISNSSWIKLPVGYNLNDHVNVRCPRPSYLSIQAIANLM